MRSAFNSLKIFCFLFTISGFVSLFAQTTGKIAGRITDAESGEPLPGVNILVEETALGASSDLDGFYYIINIPPGDYSVQVVMVGYKTMVFKNTVVSVNRTTEVSAEMQTDILESEAIVVTADAVTIKKDQTSSIRNISSEKIEVLPIENLGEVINMQAGVIDGHFRGGRLDEVSYMIDGMQVDESFSGVNTLVEIEPDAIQDLEVITGTFNPEYGRAMSGIVNAVTKEGGSDFHGMASIDFANFFTNNTDVFVGLGSEFTLNLSEDYKIQFEGPLVGNWLSFFTNIRYQRINGHLNGVRRFNPIDYNDYSAGIEDEWHTENTGDGSYVSMIQSHNLSFLGKLTLRPMSSMKLSAMLTMNDDENQGYSHFLKYNPDARGTSYRDSYMFVASFNHMLSPSFFYEIKFSHIDNTYQSYKYEDPVDSRYLHPRYYGQGNTGFSTGGSASPGKSEDTYRDMNLKFDINWQINREHSLKSGVDYISHYVDRNRVDVRNMYWQTPLENELEVDPETGKIYWPYYKLEVLPVTEKTIDVYQVNPFAIALYVQDKMEFDDIVINLGVRYDYFYPDQVYPTDRRNPDNELLLPDSMQSSYPKADAQTQLSPRFGMAYQLGKKAVLHFSYGHFFQMPPMYALYANNIFRVPLTDYGTTMGNAQLNAQKTISYEIGLWQEISNNMSLEVALYYRDIYDLLSTKIISTYNQVEYGLYTNKDYGNSRGLEIKWNLDFSNFYTDLNYTLAYTRGNADNPMQTFTRAGNSMDPIKRLIPMSWDQRHTLNITAGYVKADYGLSLTGYYNSGVPFTYQPLRESALYNVNLYQNNAYQPSGFSLDLSAYYKLWLFGNIGARITLKIYNLLDAMNAVWVYSDTGQPYTTIVRESQLLGHHSDFNDYYDRVENPSAYSAPRMVKLGFGIIF